MRFGILQRHTGKTLASGCVIKRASKSASKSVRTMKARARLMTAVQPFGSTHPATLAPQVRLCLCTFGS